MSALRQVEELLLALSRAEKAQLLRLVAQDLDDAFPGIDSTPGVCGGEPCIVRTRVPVRVLEQSRMYYTVNTRADRMGSGEKRNQPDEARHRL